MSSFTEGSIKGKIQGIQIPKPNLQNANKVQFFQPFHNDCFCEHISHLQHLPL